MPTGKEAISTLTQEKIAEIFDDFQSRQNIVGLYDLLYKIDRRVNPELYIGPQTQSHD